VSVNRYVLLLVYDVPIIPPAFIVESLYSPWHPVRLPPTPWSLAWHALIKGEHEPALKVQQRGAVSEGRGAMGMAYERVGGWLPGNEQPFHGLLSRLGVFPAQLALGTVTRLSRSRSGCRVTSIPRPCHGSRQFPGFSDDGHGLVVDLRRGQHLRLRCDICPRLRVTPITPTARPPRQGRSCPASWPCHSLLAVPSPMPTKHPIPPWAVVADPSWSLPSPHRPYQPPPHDSPWIFSTLVVSAWQTPLLSSNSFLCCAALLRPASGGYPA